MNDHEIDRVSAAVNRLRPDWPTASIRTIIAKHLADRPRRDVAVALAWVACEPQSATPARVLEAGPWWRAASVEGGTTREPFDRGSFCAHCEQPADRCRRIWADDHEFESHHEYRKRLAHDPRRNQKETQQ